MTVRGEKFNFLNIIGGATMSEAQMICLEKGMALFEPKDATINYLVWEKARENYQLEWGYWLNVKKENQWKM